MGSFPPHENLEHQTAAARRITVRLTSSATRELAGFVLVSLVCFLATPLEHLVAAEPQAPGATATASQSDGRLLGYTRLREGTCIPETLGTVIALGPRRWAFVPAASPSVEVVQSVTQPESVIQLNGRLTRRVDSATRSKKKPAVRYKGVGNRGGLAASVLKQAANAGSDQSSGEHLVLITENLMLQRVVQAIQEDELDSSWELTGRVSEYFGENRLTILTAQRAQAKQLTPASVR